MKTIVTLATVLAATTTFSQASTCPESNYDGCFSDGYGIVEVEPNTYWAHQQMESAHWIGFHFSTKRTHGQVRHHTRRRVRRSCR